MIPLHVKISLLEQKISDIQTQLNKKIELKSLPVDTDFNTIKDTGLYGFGASPTGNNKPINKSGFLEVLTYGVLTTQRYTTYDGSNIYIRGFYKTWTSWLTYKS